MNDKNQPRTVPDDMGDVNESQWYEFAYGHPPIRSGRYRPHFKVTPFRSCGNKGRYVPGSSNLRLGSRMAMAQLRFKQRLEQC